MSTHKLSALDQYQVETASAGGTTAEVAVQARHSTPFDVLAVQFDFLSGQHLAVSGLRSVQV